MTERVVDTNVGIVANGASNQAAPACIAAATQALLQLQRNERIVIDDDYRILREYLRYLAPAGQPGPGDAFLRWVLLNQQNLARCVQVPLTQRSADEADLAEFPSDADLAGFDRSDRKFVAVALASGLYPEIDNATDTDWWQFRTALQRNGVRVRFLCPDLMGR